MSEARMDRMEDMMHQLIGMVGNVISSQNDMKKDIVEMKEDIVVIKKDIVEMKEDIVVIKKDIVEMKEDIVKIKTNITCLNERVDRVCYQHDKSFQYLNAKASQHDHDIYMLQQSQK